MSVAKYLVEVNKSDNRPDLPICRSGIFIFISKTHSQSFKSKLCKASPLHYCLIYLAALRLVTVISTCSFQFLWQEPLLPSWINWFLVRIPTPSLLPSSKNTPSLPIIFLKRTLNKGILVPFKSVSLKLQLLEVASGLSLQFTSEPRASGSHGISPEVAATEVVSVTHNSTHQAY